jgi:thiamine kinase-like enzyme
LCQQFFSAQRFAMAGELKDLVTPAEVLRVAKKIHGPSCKLLDFKVEKATSSVQGFLSNILRVTAWCEIHAEQSQSVKFIVKRFPELQMQQDLVNELGGFDQEIGFFQHCVPILIEQRADLPVVRCFDSILDDKIIYLEDLKELNYVALIRSVPELKNDVLSLEHFKVMMEALAKLHSASYGIDWLEKFPQLFQFDPMFEGAGAELFKKVMKQSLEATIIPIAELAHSENKELLKNIRWLASEDFFSVVQKLSKADPSTKNVLCHGDSWVNNMMFKLDADNKPLDVKLIDFQICRYAPPSRDLLYCLNASASANFRNKHERQILKFYHDAFSKSCSDLGKDCLMSWDELYSDYDGARVFGLVMSLVYRPMIHLAGNFPEGDAQLTEEQFKKLTAGSEDAADASIRAFHENEDFRAEMLSVLDDAHAIIQKLEKCV